MLSSHYLSSASYSSESPLACFVVQVFSMGDRSWMQTSLTNSIIWVFLLWCVQNVQKVTHLCHLDGRIIHCKAYISYVNGALKNNSKISNILCKEYTHWQQCVYSFQTFTFLLSFLFVNDVFGEPRSPSFSVISSLLFFSSCLSFSSSFFLTSTSSYLFKIGRK